MIDAGTIIRMIEYRRQIQPSPPDVAAKEQDPSSTPAFRLWNSPHYLILLIEKELQTLAAAGASPAKSIEILADVFSLDKDLSDDESLTMSLLDRVFPQFTDCHSSIVGELRLMARNSLPAPDQFRYPQKEWLNVAEIPLEELDREFDGRLSRCLVIPKSEFQAQLQHFAIMSRLGGQVFSFSSPSDTWKLMMGRGGYALVQEERSLAFVETIMN